MADSTEVNVSAEKSLVNVDVDDKKFARIQKYFLVFALLVMGWCISVMWKQNGELQKDFRGAMFDLLLKNNMNLQDNTNALKELRIEVMQQKTDRKERNTVNP